MELNYTFINDLLEQLPEIPDNSIISRTLYDDERVKAVLFGFAPGQELSEHTSALHATIHVLQGQGVLTLGEQRHEAQAGTWVHMQPRLPHRVQATDSSLVLLLLLHKIK